LPSKAKWGKRLIVANHATTAVTQTGSGNGADDVAGQIEIR
jgi:hypothetical protein